MVRKKGGGREGGREENLPEIHQLHRIKDSSDSLPLLEQGPKQPFLGTHARGTCPSPR